MADLIKTIKMGREQSGKAGIYKKRKKKKKIIKKKVIKSGQQIIKKPLKTPGAYYTKY